MTLDELYEKIKEICPNAVIHETETGEDEIYIATGFRLRDEETGELEEFQETRAALSPNAEFHYFATDGNYGDANGLVVVETTKWNELDWEAVEESNDESLPATAEIIAKRYGK